MYEETKHLVFLTADDNTTGRELYVIPSNGVNLPAPAARNRADNPHAQKHYTLGNPSEDERLSATIDNLLDIEPPEIE